MTGKRVWIVSSGLVVAVLFLLVRPRDDLPSLPLLDITTNADDTGLGANSDEQPRTASSSTKGASEAAADREHFRQPVQQDTQVRVAGGDHLRAELGPHDLAEWVALRSRGLDASESIRGSVPHARMLADIRTGSGVTFRADLEWTARDHETQQRHQDAIRLGPDTYFSLLADTDTPLLPWKKLAVPIVCNGQEYFSGHFSIPEENIASRLPAKERDWATVVPGRKETYVFRREEDYRRDLEVSRFGITRRRYGFATNRNLEMLAAGCVPYFCGIERVPRVGTLDSLPKQFLEKFMRFPGVAAKCNPPRRAVGFPVNRNLFNETRYRAVAGKLLDYTRLYQTTAHFAKYVLSATSMATLPRRVLIIWASHYTIMLTGFVHGLRALGIEVVDVPRRAEIYRGEQCPVAQARTYAKGWFFFCRANESLGVSRLNVEKRIRERYFDVVVLSVTDTLTYHMKNPYTEIPFYRAVVESYPRDLVLAMNDADLIKPMTADVAHKFLHNQTLYFKRETHGCHEGIW